MFGSARTAAGGLFSTAGSEHAHLYGSTLLVPGGRRGCTSGCWRPDVTLPVDVRDHRLGSGALCRHDPGTADRHHADRLWLDQPGDSGGSVPPALDQLLMGGAQGQVRLEGHGPCLLPDREAGVPVRTLRCGRRRYPDPAGVRGGAGRRDPVRSRQEAQSAGLSPDGGQPVRSDREFLGVLERAADVEPGGAHRQPRQARNDAGHGGGGERNPGRDHLAARCLVHEEVPDRRCPHARRHRHRPGDTALYEPPPPGKPGRPRKYGDRITREKLRTLTQTHTELPIYGSHRTVRYRTAVCRARFRGGRPVRAVWVSMFVDGKWTAERLLLSTDPGHTAEDVIISLRWTIEPMFAALKWGEGMIDMWMQSVDPKGSGSKTFHRWLSIVQIGRALIQMLAVKADAATTALAEVAAGGKEGYLTAGMVKASLVRAFWNIAPAEA